MNRNFFMVFVTSFFILLNTTAFAQAALAPDHPINLEETLKRIHATNMVFS